MEQIKEFLPIAFVLLLLVSALLSPFQAVALSRMKRRLQSSASNHSEEMDKTLEAHAHMIGKLCSEQAQELETIQSQHEKALERYSAIVDLDVELSRLDSERAKRKQNIEDEMLKLNAQRKALSKNISDIRASYKEKRQIYDRLRNELAIFDERLSFAELGVYEPHFDFGDSETYKAEINAIRSDQKAMVKSKCAVFGTKTWTVDGSVSRGETMVNRAVRLTLRAFNNECEASIANTRWNNVLAMEKRIGRARSAVNKLNASNNIIISGDYFEAKLKELHLTHEYREKLKQERDERAGAARLEREEKRLLKEAKAAQREHERYQALLDKARAEAGVVSSEKQQAKIYELELQLAEAHEKSERAKAMAERTKSGFVYIISNIGSFGEDVVKIGLTRRLDPSDRVRELGDASVPFLFDTHAMIYSEEAPALESALHNEFAARRVNAANMRKEFFRVTLDEVEEAVKRLAPEANFHTDIEAQEFFETLARRKELAAKLAQQDASEMPAEI